MAEKQAEPDLVLTEHFHHLKRTAVLLCSAIIVTVVPGVDFGAAAQSVWAPFRNVPQAWVLMLLWLGSSYYAVGFLLEYMAVHRRNFDLLVDRSGANLAGLLREANEVTAGALQTLKAASDGLPDVSAENILAGLREQIADSLEKHAPIYPLPLVSTQLQAKLSAVGERTVRADLSPELANDMSRRWLMATGEITGEVYLMLKRQRDELVAGARSGHADGTTHELNRVLGALNAQAKAVTDLKSALPGLRKPLATLNRYGYARTFQFWGWEGTATAAMWLFATSIAWWHAPQVLGPKTVWFFQA